MNEERRTPWKAEDGAKARHAFWWLSSAHWSHASRDMFSSSAAVSAHAIMEGRTPYRFSGWDMTRARWILS